jgi:hypothetical protein
VTVIRVNAFSSCHKLSSICIPNSVKRIEHFAFASCSSLVSISVEDSNRVYYSKNDCVIERDTERLIFGTKKSIIPDSVRIIGKYAFYDCSGLTSIVIPDGVTKIEESAFGGCYNLKSITFPRNLSIIEGYIFEHCTELTIRFKRSRPLFRPKDWNKNWNKHHMFDRRAKRFSIKWNCKE